MPLAMANKKRTNTTARHKPAVGDPAVLHDDTIVAIPVDKLHDHPSNPEPTEAEVLAMIQWLDGNLGQLEPITVRPGEHTPADHDVPLGHYQVLAGKTRLAAARRLGWESLAARIRQDLANEAAAIEIMAGTNQQRRVENPLRQAAMIEALIAAGVGAVEAGRMYGLESATSVANKLRLRLLPEVWQQRVISGEVHETIARMLVPYVDLPKLLQAFDADYRATQESSYHDERTVWHDRDGARDAIMDVISKCTRPIEDDDTWYDSRCGRYAYHRRMFELTPDTEAACEVVRLPIGKNGKLIRRALNVEAYDALNDPLIEASLNKSAPTAKVKSHAKAGKLTPAQQAAATAAAKADDRRRRAEAEKKLAVGIQVWRHRFLRMLIADRIEAGSYVTATLLPWVMANARERRNEFSTDPAPLGRYLEAAAMIVAAENNRCPAFRGMDEGQALGPLVHLVTTERLEDEIQASLDVQAMLLRFLLWPQCEVRPRSLEWLLSPEPPQAWRKRKSSDRTPAVFLLELSDESVDTMASRLDVAVADGWRRGGIGGSRERALVQEYFDLHTREQLDELAGELLGVKSVAAEQIRSQKRFGDAVHVLMSEHTSKSPLPLPASLGAARPRRKK